ncbi:hydroxyisourate hydrolase [Cytobacillus oceanisediminis]|uniref:5-hydroxyisourate hydrolase n=1 Tax=Niallia alba TaxID=2729105 RepID=A0A7Y0K8I2_9BACI|nr:MULTISPECIES: hydroxyisourate hydrolase [Bacillaceae]EOR22793.1 urate oxidase structural factor [Niallia nealsonii AAU1]MBQ6446145.1 hydroxyisourate hydrolase [Bacillus sp. (in: firmicutes)]MDU1843977.1 hydroxyisourate hydrolase [Niallia nealsonii]MBZ9535101.1 hydroxyisourate hydrolase [Cytobacillus oceanisediminis]MED3794098.1 hydroxyisourate hydrolase [Niallia alba]
MKTGITTHVLDLTQGKPGAGIKVELWEITNSTRTFIANGLTNEDGRVETVLLEKVEDGEYELVFLVKEYFQRAEGKNNFLTSIPIRFYTDKTQVHYHIPLLLSGWGYQTYRGS